MNAVELVRTAIEEERRARIREGLASSPKWAEVRHAAAARVKAHKHRLIDIARGPSRTTSALLQEFNRDGRRVGITRFYQLLHALQKEGRIERVGRRWRVIR